MRRTPMKRTSWKSRSKAAAAPATIARAAMKTIAPATRLTPVLLPYGAPTGEQAEEAERDIGQLGNDLRQVRKQVEAVLAQFSDLRFRLTI